NASINASINAWAAGEKIRWSARHKRGIQASVPVSTCDMPGQPRGPDCRQDHQQQGYDRINSQLQVGEQPRRGTHGAPVTINDAGVLAPGAEGPQQRDQAEQNGPVN